MNEVDKSKRQGQVFDLLWARSIGWIQAADQKAATMLGFLAAFSALIGVASPSTSLETWSKPWSLTILVLVVFVIGMATSVACCFAVLMPRTNRRLLVAPDSEVECAWTYFGDAAELPLRDLKKKTAELSADQLRAVEHEQAYVVAKIASTKMKWFTRAGWAFAVTFIAFTMLSLVSAVAPEKTAQSGIEVPR